MTDHGQHGQGDDGPDDSDCSCCDTKEQSACASAGCGFCGAAEDMSLRRYPEDMEEIVKECVTKSDGGKSWDVDWTSVAALRAELKNCDNADATHARHNQDTIRGLIAALASQLARPCSSSEPIKRPMGRHMVMDVESIGLHGEGFAVAWVVIQDGEVVSEVWAVSDPTDAFGSEEGRKWVAENCEWINPGTADEPMRIDSALLRLTPSLRSPSAKFETAHELREFFWSAWLDEKKSGAKLWADVTWPVEVRFLGQCVEDARPKAGGSQERIAARMTRSMPESLRGWEGPYPLYDVATFMLARGVEQKLNARLSEEMPVHHPLADARQSARLLVEHWNA